VAVVAEGVVSGMCEAFDRRRALQTQKVAVLPAPQQA